MLSPSSNGQDAGLLSWRCRFDSYWRDQRGCDFAFRQVGVWAWQFGHSIRKFCRMLLEVFPSTWSTSSAIGFPIQSESPQHRHFPPCSAKIFLRIALRGSCSVGVCSTASFLFCFAMLAAFLMATSIASVAGLPLRAADTPAAICALISGPWFLAFAQRLEQKVPGFSCITPHFGQDFNGTSYE